MILIDSPPIKLDTEKSFSVDMKIPTAQEMASALTYLHNRLGELDLINYSQSIGIMETASRLKKFGSDKAWHYRIERSKPLILKSVTSARLNAEISPIVFIDIEVDEAFVEKKGFPFKTLNLTLEIINESNGRLIHRSHIDLATHNEEGQYQDGPIFHLQFGGKSGGKQRDLNVFKLRRPRWLHPPMDLILMTEMLIANFYPEQWGKLRNQPAWKALITDSQMLCYKPFFDVAIENIENDSLLSSFWARSSGYPDAVFEL